MEIKIPDLQSLPKAAEEFLRAVRNHKLIAFDAPMGAGKTTFIAEICRQLGVTDDSGSPTFSIINEYEGNDGRPVYHFDFYRIESPEEALDLGVDDYFFSGNLCLMEWAGRIGSLLPEETLTVTISVGDDGSRSLIFTP